MSSRDDHDLQIFKRSKMSNKSIAMMLGWSEARVERRLAELEQLAAEPQEEAAHDQDPAPPAPDAKAHAAEEEGPQDPVAVVAACPPAYLEQDQVRLALRALIAVSSIDFGRLARPVQRRRLKAVTPSIRRWAARFVDARWSLEVVASLFGVDADDLAQALRTAA